MRPLHIGCRGLAALLLLALLVPAALPARAAEDGAIDAAGIRERVAEAASRGAVTIVNFWATWCGPCRDEIPHLKTLRAEFSKGELAILGVSLDLDQVAYTRFVTAHPFGYATAWGGERLMEDLGVRAIPRTEVYGPDGALHTVFDGAVKAEALRREITLLLGQGKGE